MNEAYERNFTGLASALDNTHKLIGEVRQTQVEFERQLQDLIQRIIILERQVQQLRADTASRGPA